MVLIILLLTFQQGGTGWMSTWWLWLFPIVAGPLIGITIRVKSFAAGAEWFAIGANWVDLYNLSSVKVKVPGYYRDLRLTDTAERRAEIDLIDIQKNQDLWDLVYNGILHSTAQSGAETNKLARKVLELPERPRGHSAEQA